MKNQILLIFLSLCFYSFGQDSISKSTNQKIKTDSKSNQKTDIKAKLDALIGDVKTLEAKKEESIYSNSYYGSGKGTGTGNGSWGLNGRKLSKPGAVKADCNDEGTVVVEVKVSKSGAVTNAKFSPSGSNTSSKCLQYAAIKSAYKYKWNDDDKAPENQIGFIVFNFRNGE